MEIKNTWGFVENYYPKYTSSDVIARNEDLTKIINGEIEGDAEKMWNEKIAELKELYNRTLDGDELEKIAFEFFECEKAKSDAYIYEKAIENFIEENKNKKAIFWSVGDFEKRAKENFEHLKENEPLKIGDLKSWESVYDKSKFPLVLEKMIKEHDACTGVTWESIDIYLSECIARGEKFARKCGITGEGINSGFVIGEGDFYIKDDLGLLKKYIAEKTDYKNIDEAYKDDFYYFTEWEDESEYQFEIVGGVLTEIEP